MPSSPPEVAAVEAIMAEQSAEPIPPDFAEAFAYAVLVYEIWTPEEPGRLIQLGSQSYSIVEVCGFVDQFTDRLPERVYLKLRSYMHDYPDGQLKADLAANPSYATAVRCLRAMMQRRTEEYKQRHGVKGRHGMEG
jgi:hypothetical protein